MQDKKKHLRYIEKCYKLYEHKMYQVAYTILRDEQMAEDAVQEAFYKLRNKKVSQLIWLGKEKEYVQLITDNSDGIFDYAIKKHGIQTMGKPIMINEKYYRNKFY